MHEKRVFKTTLYYLKMKIIFFWEVRGSHIFLYHGSLALLNRYVSEILAPAFESLECSHLGIFEK